MERIARATTVRDEVYVRLRDAISDGSLPAGAPLVSTDLADRFGVSRTPVREAIMRLVQDGLAVEGAPGQGVSVRTVDRNEIEAFFEIRAALEELAARMTVLRQDEAALAAVIAAEEELEEQVAVGARPNASRSSTTPSTSPCTPPAATCCWSGWWSGSSR